VVCDSAVLILDEARRASYPMAAQYGLTREDVDGSFFFAAPMAALGAQNLFGDLRRLGRF
jgi:hypothetical protein